MKESEKKRIYHECIQMQDMLDFVICYDILW